MKKITAVLSSLVVFTGAMFLTCNNVSANTCQYIIEKHEDGTITAYYITPDNMRVQNDSLKKIFMNKEKIKTQTDIYSMLGKGDVNGNGKIDLSDAKIALKGALGIIKLSDEEAEQCDILSTGEKIDLNDVHYLLEASLGIVIEEPCIMD